MCFVRISQQKKITFLWSNDWLVSSLHRVSVFCEARTQLLCMCYITLALESIQVTFRLTDLSKSVEFCYSSQLRVALLSKKVTVFNKTRISITVLTKARYSMISFYILKIIYLNFILISSSLRA